MTIDNYFSKVKSLYCEISELDPLTVIYEYRIKRIIVHGLRPEFKSFVTAIQVWPTQSTIEEFENLLAN